MCHDRERERRSRRMDECTSRVFVPLPVCGDVAMRCGVELLICWPDPAGFHTAGNLACWFKNANRYKPPEVSAGGLSARARRVSGLNKVSQPAWLTRARASELTWSSVELRAAFISGNSLARERFCSCS